MSARGPRGRASRPGGPGSPCSRPPCSCRRGTSHTGPAAATRPRRRRRAPRRAGSSSRLAGGPTPARGRPRRGPRRELRPRRRSSRHGPPKGASPPLHVALHEPLLRPTGPRGLDVRLGRGRGRRDTRGVGVRGVCSRGDSAASVQDGPRAGFNDAVKQCGGTGWPRRRTQVWRPWHAQRRRRCTGRSLAACPRRRRSPEPRRRSARGCGPWGRALPPR